MQPYYKRKSLRWRNSSCSYFFWWNLARATMRKNSNSLPFAWDTQKCNGERARTAFWMWPSQRAVLSVVTPVLHFQSFRSFILQPKYFVITEFDCLYSELMRSVVNKQWVQILFLLLQEDWSCAWACFFCGCLAAGAFQVHLCSWSLQTILSTLIWRQRCREFQLPEDVVFQIYIHI